MDDLPTGPIVPRPAPPGAFDAVLAKARHRRRVRVLTVTGLAAAALVVVALPAAITRFDSSARKVQIGVTASDGGGRSSTVPSSSTATTTSTSTTTAGLSTSTTTTTISTVPNQSFVFPDTTFKQAQEAQTAVDQGHQPWRLDPGSVASAYGASLGWTNTTVTPVDANVYDITTTDNAMRLRLTMSQPTRQDQTGIWEIVTATPM